VDRIFNRVLDRLEEWLIASFMAAATLIIFAAVSTDNRLP